MEKENIILLESLELSNKLSISLYDLSRKVAADRWLVRIKCVASASLPEEFFEKMLAEEDDRELVKDIREKFGGSLTFEAVRELNFVDDDDKDKSVAFLMDSLKGNSVDYMGRESFLEKLLFKKYDEFRQEIQTRRELCLVEKEGDDNEEEGPVDFSSCFRD